MKTVAEVRTESAVTHGGRLLVEGVSKAYGDHVVLQDLTIDVSPGCFVALVGPSGCGKTTLLDILGGLRRPDSGSVSLNGNAIDGPTDRVGFVFQEESTLPWRTVEKNVALPLELRKEPKQVRDDAVAEALRIVGLAEAHSRYPRQLSGGMRQRVAIARLLTTRPEVFLLDEPFGALDEQLRMMLGLQMRHIIRSAGSTGVLITHSIQEAILLADRVLVLSKNPANVIADLTVELPSERSIESLAQPHASALSAQIWAALKDRQ